MPQTTIDPAALADFLAGWDPAFGARPLRRVIEHMVEDPLSEALLEGRFKAGDMVRIDCQNGEIVLDSSAVVSPTT